jgi:hypothetical protein
MELWGIEPQASSFSEQYERISKIDQSLLSCLSHMQLRESVVTQSRRLLREALLCIGNHNALTNST